MDPVSFHQALADPTRWRIAVLLDGRLLCVCELEDALLLPQSTLSSHLSIMRAAGLLEVVKKGKWAYYRISDDARLLFQGIKTHFAGSIARDRTVAQDRRRAETRVALRGTTDGGTTRRRPIPPGIDEPDTTNCC